MNTQQFLKDVERHELTVIRDEGLHRHLRFKRPGTYCMHFDLITWPGYLCYTGDMGTYVFQRLEDMLQFFRRDAGRPPFRIDRRYWAEKVQAQDKGDGITEFSPAKFKAEVKDYFDQATDDADAWTPELKADLWAEIEDGVFGRLEDFGEHGAWTALRDFCHVYRRPGEKRADREFRFEDWERDCREYTHRFDWCCMALEWSIGVYDAQREAVAATTEVPA